MVRVPCTLTCTLLGKHLGTATTNAKVVSAFLGNLSHIWFSTILLEFWQSFLFSCAASNENCSGGLGTRLTFILSSLSDTFLKAVFEFFDRPVQTCSIIRGKIEESERQGVTGNRSLLAWAASASLLSYNNQTNINCCNQLRPHVQLLTLGMHKWYKLMTEWKS